MSHMSRVEKIMERVNTRTESMLGVEREDIEVGQVVGGIVTEVDASVMFVGLPLSYDECVEYCDALHVNMVKMALEGIPPMIGVEALFRHAVLFGLLAHTVEGG